MPPELNRRAALGLGATATAGVVLSSTAVASADETEPGQAPPEPTPTTPEQARKRVGKVYQRETTRAAGIWNSLITVANPDGTLASAVEDKADERVEAYSVNKIAVATAVLDKVDRGLLRLDQRVDVTADIVVTTGDGIFRLDLAYPSSVTLGHVMANLLSVSDDTSVRLCGLVCPAKEVNEILVAKGFPQTQVTPVANPNRFFLGTTTPRETHDLLQALVKGLLLSATSTSFLLGILRSPWRSPTASGARCRPTSACGWRPRRAGSSTAATRRGSCSTPPAGRSSRTRCSPTARRTRRTSGPRTRRCRRAPSWGASSSTPWTS